MRISEFLSRFATRDGEHGAPTRHQLRQLLAFRLDLDTAQLLARPERALTAAQQAGLIEDAQRLSAGEPLAYVLGEIPFMQWDFSIDHRALIPRPETEALIARLIAATPQAEGVKPPATVLDLCCGSGVMGLSLALAFPEARVWLTDISAAALELAAANVSRHDLGARVTLLQGDLWAALPAGLRFDWVVANPPYVAADDAVETSVLAFEPAQALFSQDGGLAHIKAILAELDARLEAGGRAAFELGHQHHEPLSAWLRSHLATARWHWQEDPFGVARYLFYDGQTQ